MMRRCALFPFIFIVFLVLPDVATAHDSAWPHFHLPYRTLQDAAARAQALLADADIGTTACCGQNAVLAIWDPLGDPTDIRLVRVRNGRSTDKRYGVKPIPWNGDRFAPDGPYNGVNTLYAVLRPARFFVLALKTNTRSEKGAIYVPHNPAYQTPEIVREGERYWTGVIREAERQIATRGVRSRIDPDKLVTETLDGEALSGRTLGIDARILYTLTIDEHMDKDEFVARGVPWTADKVLVTFALNRERTYWYSYSKTARAGGAAQFIEITWLDLATNYPAARLHPKHVDGIRDHVNAVIAQFCLLDRILAHAIRQGVTLPAQEDRLLALVAASYNAGESVGTPYYLEHHRMCILKRRKCRYSHDLPAETRTYLRKASRVRRHLFG